MPDLLVELSADETVRGTIVRDEQKHVHGQNLGSVKGSSLGREVFSAFDFIAVVCRIQIKYARIVFRSLKTALEEEGLVWHVPLRVKSRPSQHQHFVATRVGPGMTRAGLQRLLVLLDSKVRQVDSAVTRFLEGESCMVTEFELDSFVPTVKA